MLLVDTDEVVGVVAPEVDELAGGVDLGLVGGLRLVEHRGRVQGLAPRAGEKLRRAEEDRHALLPRRPRPLRPRVRGGGDRLLDLVGAALVDVGEDVLLAMGHDRLEGRARADVLAADDARDLHSFRLQLLEARLELGALRATGRVRAHRLVDGCRRPEGPVNAHAAIVC